MHNKLTIMPIQTRSMTQRAGEPHDLEAFHSYAEDLTNYVDAKLQQLNDDDDDLPYSEERHVASDDDSYVPSEDEEEDSRSWLEGDEFFHEELLKDVYDDHHFCPSWNRCCEENLARKPIKRWPEQLTTWREHFTRGQWNYYIGEICWKISYDGASDDVLTTEEYEAARNYMHGK